MVEKDIREQTENQPVDVKLSWSISVLFLLIGMGFLYVMKSRGIGRIEELIIFFCLGVSAAAGLFGGLRSYARYRLQRSKSKKVTTKTKTEQKKFLRSLELGGPVVILFLFVFVGPEVFHLTGDGGGPFDFIVYLKDNAGQTVIENRGTLTITLNKTPRTEKIGDNGRVIFTGIHEDFKNIEVPAEMRGVDGWRFKNTGTTVTDVKLSEQSPTLVVERDDSLCCISGSVIDSERNVIVDAEVTVKDISTSTDKTGRFYIEIPHVKQARELPLTIFKKGFKLWEKNVYPGTKEEVKAVLEREEIK